MILFVVMSRFDQDREKTHKRIVYTHPFLLFFMCESNYISTMTMQIYTTVLCFFAIIDNGTLVIFRITDLSELPIYMYMTSVNLVWNQEKCKLRPLSTFCQSFFSNNGATATAKPGCDEDCMQQQYSSLVVYHSDSKLI